MTTAKKITEKYLKKVPDLKPGDTVRVHQKIKEGAKERIQVFEGVVLRVKGSGINASFLVRKISFGIGVEKNFLLHSPNISKIEVKKRAKVRQAYLTYLRDLRGKSARLRDKQFDALAVNIKEEPVEEVVKAEEVPLSEVEKSEEKEATKEDKKGSEQAEEGGQAAEEAEVEAGEEKAEEDLEKGKAKEGKKAEKAVEEEEPAKETE